MNHGYTFCAKCGKCYGFTGSRIVHRIVEFMFPSRKHYRYHEPK